MLHKKARAVCSDLVHHQPALYIDKQADLQTKYLPGKSGSDEVYTADALIKGLEKYQEKCGARSSKSTIYPAVVASLRQVCPVL